MNNISENMLILAEEQYYSLDCHKTQLNNNVLVVGTSGAGKTRSVVVPNLLMASGSYIVSDPKGNLYKRYKGYLESQGYVVKKLDFTNPEDSVRYNFFEYIRTTQDIVKMSHMLTYQQEGTGTKDPFWDEAAKLLLQAAIALFKERGRKIDQNLSNLLKLIGYCQVQEDAANSKNPCDILFDEHAQKNSDSYAVRQYNKFRVAASRTLKSILITVNARLGTYDTPELQKMTARDDINISSIGRKKTALFVVVSDTDRSLDGLVNIFFTQAMNELTRYADKECENECLPVPVRFILDDFATNCCIEEFPRMISSIRSRGISAMLMIQAESQLSRYYGHDAKTIISNCDTYIYMGGNDTETAQEVAKRCDLPLKRILYMPVGSNWIFRRGQAPINGKNFMLEPFLEKLSLKCERVTGEPTHSHNSVNQAKDNEILESCLKENPAKEVERAS